MADEALPLIKANAHPRHLEGILTEEELAAYTFSRELALTTRVSDETVNLPAALGGDRAMADLSLTIACYHGVSVLLLNSFEVALPRASVTPSSFPRFRDAATRAWWRSALPPLHAFDAAPRRDPAPRDLGSVDAPSRYSPGRAPRRAPARRVRRAYSPTAASSSSDMSSSDDITSDGATRAPVLTTSSSSESSGTQPPCLRTRAR